MTMFQENDNSEPGADRIICSKLPAGGLWPRQALERFVTFHASRGGLVQTHIDLSLR